MPKAAKERAAREALPRFLPQAVLDAAPQTAPQPTAGTGAGERRSINNAAAAATKSTGTLMKFDASDDDDADDALGAESASDSELDDGDDDTAQPKQSRTRTTKQTLSALRRDLAPAQSAKLSSTRQKWLLIGRNRGSDGAVARRQKQKKAVVKSKHGSAGAEDVTTAAMVATQRRLGRARRPVRRALDQM